MAASLGTILKKILLRWLIYLLGLVVVLSLLGVGAFVVARPQIDEIVQREIKKRGVEVDGWDVSLSGRMNLHNIRLNLPDGAQLTASLAAVRPPIPGFSGAATFYDITITRDSASLTIPELDITGIELHEKDNAITSPILQGLMRVEIGTLTAPHLRLVAPIEGKPVTAQIEGIALDDFSQGQLQLLSFANLTLSLDNDATQLGSGVVEIHNIDVIDTVSYLSSHLADSWQPRKDLVVGPISVKSVAIKAQTGDHKEALNLELGSLRSQGIALQAAQQKPIDIIQAIAKGNNTPENLRHLAQTLAQSITTFDMEIHDVATTFRGIASGFKSFTLKPSNWTQLVPQAIDIDMDGFLLDISNLEGEEIETIKAMGYGRLDLSLATAASWDERARQLTLAHFDIDIKNMGRARMTGSFTNVDEALFAGSDAPIMEIVENIALHEANITLQDQGATQNIVTFLTKEIDISADEVMEHLQTIVTGLAQALFEEAQQQEMTADALVAFLHNAESLNIHMTATGTNGDVSLAAIGNSLDNMHSLSEQLHLTFTHESN